MNFFKGVKQKLSSVGDDISKSLNLRAPRKDSSLKQITIDDCSFLGGAQLLEKYQNDWSSLHDGNEGIAKIANRIDVTIGILHSFVTKQHVQYWHMSQLITNDLPRLETDLDSICSALGSLTEAMERAEVALATLEDQIEWGELTRREEAANTAWQTACRRSISQVEAARVARAQEHAHRMARTERDRQSSLRERAATFEEEFQRDIEYYREHGKVERTMSHTSATEDELAVIQVASDKDEEALNDFLETAVVSEGLDSANVGSPEDLDASDSSDAKEATEELVETMEEKEVEEKKEEVRETDAIAAES